MKKATTQSTKMIDFMKYKWLYFAISLAALIPGIYSLITFGLKPAIDFTGGTLLEIQTTGGATLTEAQIRSSAGEGIEISSIQSSGTDSYVIRMKPITKDQNEEFKYNLASVSAQIDPNATDSAQLMPLSNIEEIRFETVGPTLGEELLKKTLTAIIIAAVAIMAYVAWRFKELKYGVCAILAMFHDTLILLGVFSILGYFRGVEIDTLFVTAVLTTLSFSVHDTIVVYDRIRESLRLHPRADFTDIVNKSVAETLARSINNSMTIIFMLLALFLMGGETIRWFVFALLVGTIAGTYSSTFTAAPLLVVWENTAQKLKNRKSKKR